MRLERSEQLASGLYHLEETEHRCPGGEGGELVVYRFAAHNRWRCSHHPQPEPQPEPEPQPRARVVIYFWGPFRAHF